MDLIHWWELLVDHYANEWSESGGRWQRHPLTASPTTA